MHIIIDLKKIKKENIEAIKYVSNGILLIKTKNTETKYLITYEKGTLIVNYGEQMYLTDLIAREIQK